MSGAYDKYLRIQYKTIFIKELTIEDNSKIEIITNTNQAVFHLISNSNVNFKVFSALYIQKDKKKTIHWWKEVAEWDLWFISSEGANVNNLLAFFAL